MARHLVSVIDIAQMLGISRQRAGQITRTVATFPPPEATVGTRSKVWSREDVEKWARATGREIKGETDGS